MYLNAYSWHVFIYVLFLITHAYILVYILSNSVVPVVFVGTVLPCFLIYQIFFVLLLLNFKFSGHYYIYILLLLATLKNKVVWITGASSGIGEFTAYQLASAGCRLVLSARRESELERVKKQCICM